MNTRRNDEYIDITEHISSHFNVVNVKHTKQEQANKTAYQHEEPHNEKNDENYILKVIMNADY